MTNEEATFWARHAQTPGGVIVVDIYKDGEPYRTGIFTKWSQANDWVDKIDREAPDECDLRAVFVPYVLDAPEFGNIPKRELS